MVQLISYSASSAEPAVACKMELASSVNCSVAETRFRKPLRLAPETREPVFQPKVQSKCLCRFLGGRCGQPRKQNVALASELANASEYSI